MVRESLKAAAQTLKRIPGKLWVVTSIMMFAEGSCLPSPSALFAEADPSRPINPGAPLADPRAIASAILLLTLIFMFITWLTGAFVQTGYLRYQGYALAGEALPMRTIVRGYDKFFSMAGATFITTLLPGLAAIALMLPGAAFVYLGGEATGPMIVGSVLSSVGALVGWSYVRIGLLWVERLIAFDSLKVKDAVITSWRATRGRYRELLPLYATYALLPVAGILGLLAFLVGALVTIPMARAASEMTLTYAYLRARSQ